MGYNEDMDNVITINDEGLMEVSPEASRNAQTSFIDTYRQLQGENTAQIGEAAHALGSDLDAQYGGLHGPSDYIKSRYQTPQTESRIAGLKTAAQLSALNQLMQNEQNKWANRYNQAYRNYQKRANSSGSGSGTTSTAGGGNEGLNITTNTGESEDEDVNTNPNTSGNNLIQTGDNVYKNLNTGETYSTADTAFMTVASSGMSLGLWPDGSKMTVGSTYTAPNGNVYTYQKFDNTPTPNVYLVGGNTYGQQSGGDGGW